MLEVALLVVFFGILPICLFMLAFFGLSFGVAWLISVAHKRLQINSKQGKITSA